MKRIATLFRKIFLRGEYPERVEVPIAGFHIFATVYLAFAVKALITGRPALVVSLFLALAALPELACFLYKRRIFGKGFKVWRFKVLAHSFVAYKGKKINSVIAAPYVSPYTDKNYEILLREDDELPEVGSVIEICMPGDIEVHEARNRYIIGGYYEMSSLEAS